MRRVKRRFETRFVAVTILRTRRESQRFELPTGERELRIRAEREPVVAEGARRIARFARFFGAIVEKATERDGRRGEPLGRNIYSDLRRAARVRAAAAPCPFRKGRRLSLI